MAVDLIQSEIDAFGKNGISPDDIQRTVNNYRADGLDDAAIRAKVDAKLNSFTAPKLPTTPPVAQAAEAAPQPVSDTKFVVGAEKNVVAQNPYEQGFYDDILNNSALTKEQKAAQIQERTASKVEEYEAERNKQLAKIWAGGALEIGSAAIPFAGAAGAGGRAALALAKPAFNQIAKKAIVKGVGQGVGSGITGGAVYGVGRGLIEDENPLVTAAQDALIGAGGGGVIGGAGAKIATTVGKSGARVKELENILDKRKDWGVAYRAVSGKPEAAVNRLLERKSGFVPGAFNKEGLGDIDLVYGKSGKGGYGLAHIIERRNSEGIDGETFAKRLPDIIKNGAIDDRDLHLGRLYINDGTNEGVVRLDWNKKDRRWVASAYKRYEKNPQNATAGLQTSDRNLTTEQHIPPADIYEDFNSDGHTTLAHGSNLNAPDGYVSTNAPANNIVTPDAQNVNGAVRSAVEDLAENTTTQAANAVDNIAALPGQETKTRGAVQTIEKAFGKEAAEAITDRTYTTRGRKIVDNELAQMTPEQVRAIIDDADDLSDLAMVARQNSIKDAISKRNVPVAELNRYAADGTKLGQAMQARVAESINTVDGAIMAMQGAIRKSTKKNVNKIIDKVPKVVKVAKGADNDMAAQKVVESLLKDIPKRERKYLVDNIMTLRENGGLTEDNLTRLINKKYKVPEIDADDITKINQLVDDINNAPDERQIEVTRGLMRKFIGDKLQKNNAKRVDTYRYINMLFSPKSKVKDFISTFAFQGEQAIDEAIAKGISKVFTKNFKGVDSRSGSFHGKEWLEGLKKGAKYAKEDIDLSITTGRAGEGTRFDIPPGTQFDYKPLQDVSEGGLAKIKQAGENSLAVLEKALNYTIRVPDRMFYEAKYAASVADMMKAQGLKEPTEEIIEQAVKEARDAVFQGDTWASKSSLAIRNALNGIPMGDFKLGNWTMPFVQTVANISEEGLKNAFGLPVGIAKGIAAKDINAMRDAELLAAKGIKGAGYLGLGAAIENGAIKSNIGENSYEDNAITGMAPQSIAIGDKSFSLANAPNATIPISISRGAVRGYKQDPDADMLEKLYNALVGAGVSASSAAADMPATKGLGDLYKVGASSFGQEKAPNEIVDELIRTYLTNMALQLVPLSGMQGNVRNIVDPYARELSNEDPLGYAGGRIINRIPGLSDNLPVRYNKIGEPVMNNNIANPTLRTLGEILFPFDIRNYNENPAYEAMKDDGMAIKRAPKSVKLDDGTKIKVTGQQYSDYQKRIGEETYGVVETLMRLPLYQRADEETREKLVSRAKSTAKSFVEAELFGKEDKRAGKVYKGNNIFLEANSIFLNSYFYNR